MKYNDKNKPLVCMMTQSTCYKGTQKFTPKGVLWHSTGANNPWLKRYVQPDDNAPDRAEWLARLGKNQYANDWNHIDRQAGLNFWIGKLADGTVAAVQTMPWDYRPWGCGSGNNGSCNNTHIQFEICEDALNDASYFNACYQEACEMTAYLCKMFGIDPKGTVSYNGLQVPTIIDHTGSHALGLGSNHGVVQHWSRRYGKTMENVRNDVAAILAADGATPTTPSVPAETEDNGKAIYLGITHMEKPFILLPADRKGFDTRPYKEARKELIMAVMCTKPADYVWRGFCDDAETEVVYRVKNGVAEYTKVR
jgi:hypothetical protein